MTRLGSVRNFGGDRERVESLVALISERDAAISALEFEVQRLTSEVQNQTKVWGRLRKACIDNIFVRIKVGENEVLCGQRVVPVT